MVLERSRPGVMAAALGSPDEEPAERPAVTDDPAGSLIVALAQCYPKLGDVAANVGMHLGVINDAAARGAGLVVFPELSITGYFLKDQVPDVALTLSSPEIARCVPPHEKDGSTSSRG